MSSNHQAYSCPNPTSISALAKQVILVFCYETAHNSARSTPVQQTLVNGHLSTDTCRPTLQPPPVDRHLSTDTCQPTPVNRHLSTDTCQLTSVNWHLSTDTCQLTTVNWHLSTDTCQPTLVNGHLSNALKLARSTSVNRKLTGSTSGFACEPLPVASDSRRKAAGFGHE